MRHFHFLSAAERQQLFARPPQDFDRCAGVDTLGMALGATLYMPATRPNLGRDLLRQAAGGVLSSVVCLEDAISEKDVPTAQANVVNQLRALAGRDAESLERLPLTFVRVRVPEQITALVDGLGRASALLSGFVLPKFTAEGGEGFFDTLARARFETGLPLLAMPVIESPEVIHSETRAGALAGIAQLLEAHRDLVLAVRLGATDLSAAYGLRRDRDLTIYDVRLVAEVITDVVNVLGRADGSGYVVTGPVWEHFPHHDRLFKPLLRQSPFEENSATRLRQELLTRDLDGLIREVVLDKANGLTGKTVIHPTHVAAVHALSVVTLEEFSDASDVLQDGAEVGGVQASTYGNKMNEAKPHHAWAERTVRRAKAFGVAAQDVSFVDLLMAGASPPSDPPLPTLPSTISTP